MADKDTGGKETPPVACQDATSDVDLRELLRQLECPLDQAIVDRGLMRLASFVAQKH